MKEIVAWLLALVIGSAIIIGLLFAFGVVGNKFNATVGRQALNVERENFEHSKPFVEGKIQDLAKYKREYERAADPAEKKQIRAYVLDEFANFDKSMIENRDLRNFLDDLEAGRK